jgi:hypothetical protein
MPSCRAFSKWRDPDSNRGHHDFQGVAGDLFRPRSTCKSPGSKPRCHAAILAVAAGYAPVWGFREGSKSQTTRARRPPGCDPAGPQRRSRPFAGSCDEWVSLVGGGCSSISADLRRFRHSWRRVPERAWRRPLAAGALCSRLTSTAALRQRRASLCSVPAPPLTALEGVRCRAQWTARSQRTRTRRG